MEFSKYYSLYKEAQENSTEDIKKYVDDKIAELDKRLEDKGQGKYNVIPSQTESRLSVIDVEKGSQVGVIAPKGKLISIPVIYGDQVSFAVQDENGRTFGTVHSLPDGSMVNQFRVGPARPGFKFKEVMGRDETSADDNGLQIEPQEEPITTPDDDTPVDREEIEDTKDQLDDIEGKLKSATTEDEINALRQRAAKAYADIQRYDDLVRGPSAGERDVEPASLPDADGPAPREIDRKIDTRETGF